MFVLCCTVSFFVRIKLGWLMHVPSMSKLLLYCRTYNAQSNYANKETGKGLSYIACWFPQIRVHAFLRMQLATVHLPICQTRNRQQLTCVQY